MLAAENDALPGAKVGGIGDVVRDLPYALQRSGATVSVVLPSYASLHLLPGTSHVASFMTGFRGRAERIELYDVTAAASLRPNQTGRVPSTSAGDTPQVRQLVLHHPGFGVCGSGTIYCDDSDGQPFSTDASKFALFSVAALTAIRDGLVGQVDVLHLHDWHTALVAVLREFDPAFNGVRQLPLIYSIHNLALQGIRPLSGNASSLQAWFPHLHYQPDALADPRWPHCINPMAAGIRLADQVSTVSPTYAAEIVQSNDPARGFHGGEGLERDLQARAEDGRLLGIINGIDYTAPVQSRLHWRAFMQALADELLTGIGAGEQVRAVDYLAHQRTLSWVGRQRPAHVLTSVGRLTDQKVALMLSPGGPASDAGTSQTVLGALLTTLDERGLLILLGSGDASIEAECHRLAARHANLLYINRYSQRLSELLFANGDLFLMPSSFEPCGISQMLAMKQGQPCLVHAVGGLRDTVTDAVDGFSFEGSSAQAQGQGLLARLDAILTMRERNADAFVTIADKAASRRFDWQTSAQRYRTELYG